jgi:hypothetical protein
VGTQRFLCVFAEARYFLQGYFFTFIGVARRLRSIYFGAPDAFSLD